MIIIVRSFGQDSCWCGERQREGVMMGNWELGEYPHSPLFVDSIRSSFCFLGLQKEGAYVSIVLGKHIKQHAIILGFCFKFLISTLYPKRKSKRNIQKAYTRKGKTILKSLWCEIAISKKIYISLFDNSVLTKSIH